MLPLRQIIFSYVQHEDISVSKSGVECFLTTISLKLEYRDTSQCLYIDQFIIIIISSSIMSSISFDCFKLPVHFQGLNCFSEMHMQDDDFINHFF